jgi:hypothetical protein
VRPLTFEHIPPKRTFNNHGVALHTLESLSKNFRGRQRFPRGLGRHSLCEGCNGRTAELYGEAYARWTIQALELSAKLSNEPSVCVPFHIHPLRVIKQLATMCLAMSDPKSVTLPHFRAFRRFVLTRHERSLPPPFRIYAYLNKDGMARFSSVAGILNVKTGRFAMVFAEVSLPPVGYCAVSEEEGEYSMARECDLCDISSFGNYDYDAFETVWLKIARLEPAGPAPLDYLSQRDDQVEDEQVA